MSLVPYLVKKYLRFDKSQPFITISAILAFLGVSIGLMVLIISMAIMNGTAKEFKDRISTMNYPITILPTSLDYKIDKKELELLKNRFPDFIFSPYIESQVIVKNGNELEGAMIFGVDFDSEAKINKIVKKALENSKIDNKFDMIMGKGLVESFALMNDDKVTLLFTKVEPGGFSTMPTMKRFKLKGEFDSGMQAYDNAYIYTTIEGLQKVLRLPIDQYDGIHVRTPHPMEDIKKIRDFISPTFGTIGWWQQNGNLFAAMAMEKKALFIVLMLIVLVASLNIISSLLMTVMNRRREIALLLSLGASKSEIKRAFFLLGSVIGGAGVLFGVFLGLFGLYLLSHFDIITLPADVYMTSKLPIDLSMTDFISIVIGAVVIVVLSSFYPAKKATDIDVLETLRNE
ncbi:MAG: ABC transporter permease [Sulfurospirillum sp.]|nr:MAG: ABC transporter permease [Sulfurospirillum sp.]